MKENVAAIIPAKGHSNRLPNKNVKPLCGYPLFYYSVKAAKLASSLQGVYVSTESDEIANLGASYGAEIIRRPQELCDDSVPNFRVIQHAVEWIEDQQGYSVDILILLQPTNPFRTPQMIDQAIEEMRGSPEADSMVSVRKSREIFGELGEEFWTPYEKQLPHRLSNSKILHVLTGHLFHVPHGADIEERLFSRFEHQTFCIG